MTAEVFIYTHLHAELPHTVRFLAEVEPLLDHPFRPTVAEKIW